MTDYHSRCPAYRVWLAFLASTAVLTGFVFLSYPVPRPPLRTKTIGFAEFKPPSPAGHPTGLTVRLNLPADFHVSYARDHADAEAGIANAQGGRQFYVIVRLASVLQEAEGEPPLQAFARQNQLVDDLESFDASAEFRTSPRGAIWCQQYVEAFRSHNQARSMKDWDGSQTDRLDVLRYAEEWQGLILELEFHVRPGNGSRLEPRIWSIVREMELVERPGS